MMIKVCGMRDAQNIREVDALGVDMIGFIFWPGSKRYVEQMPEYLPMKAKRVGVFVNATAEEIAQRVHDYRLDFVQLHGDEDLAYVSNLHKALQQTGLPMPRIIRALHVRTRSQVLKATMWDGFVDGILFESDTQGHYGGSGVQFDWSILSSYRGRTPFFITGGIGPDSLENLKEFSHPQWLGVDLNSCFESAPGMKDVNLLLPFITELKKSQLKGTTEKYEL